MDGASTEPGELDYPGRTGWVIEQREMWHQRRPESGVHEVENRRIFETGVGSSEGQSARLSVSLQNGSRDRLRRSLDPRPVPQLGEGGRRPPFLGDRDQVSIIQQVCAAQSWRAHPVARLLLEQGDVDGTGMQRTVEGGLVQLHDPQVDSVVFTLQPRAGRQHQMPQRRRKRRDGEVALDRFGQRSELGFDPVQACSKIRGVFGEPAADLGQGQGPVATATRSVDQAQSGLPLQGGDVLRDAGRHEVEPPGGCRDAAGRRHCVQHEEPMRIKMHAVRLSHQVNAIHWQCVHAQVNA